MNSDPVASVRARVIAVHKNRWEIQLHDGRHLEAIAVRGLDPDLPVVGDWVTATLRQTDTIARITAIEPRRTYLSRKRPGDVEHDAVVEQPIAANIDVALLAMADDDFSVRRLERYLTLAWDSGATPIIVLTKADLTSPEVLQLMAADAQSVSLGIQTVVTSAFTGQGLNELREILVPGSCAIVLGSSGVGKSSLLNALAGTDLQNVSHVRQFDGKGRHTTTSRRLIELPWGAYLVDTPGLRELQIWGDEQSLSHSFADVEDIAAQCRFSDCTHDTEPGCAVQEAVAQGLLAAERLQSWRRLHRELAYLARKTDGGAARAERQRWKAIAKQQRAIKRDR
ncbi:MAG: ribosome small subunit-dependent GTPase A [Candidatus Nanopelagicales bacterium]